MNKQTLLIIIGLALPVIALIILTRSEPKDAEQAAQAQTKPVASAPFGTHPTITLAQERQKAQDELDRFQKMDQAQWNEFRKTQPWRAPTVAQAIENHKKHLAQLSAMTEAQWEAQQAPKRLGNAVPQPAQMPASAQPAR